MPFIGANHSDKYDDNKELNQLVEKCLELSEISFKDEVEGNHKYNITSVVTPKIVRGMPRKVRHTKSVKREIGQDNSDDTTPTSSPDKKRLKKDIVAEAVLETIEKREDTGKFEAQVARVSLFVSVSTFVNLVL